VPFLYVNYNPLKGQEPLISENSLKTALFSDTLPWRT